MTVEMIRAILTNQPVNEEHKAKWSFYNKSNNNWYQKPIRVRVRRGSSAKPF